MFESTAKKLTKRRLLFYGTALAASLIPALLSAFLIWQVRTSDYASGGRTALSIAKLIADDFGNSFDNLDAVLLSIGRQYVDGIESGPDERSRLAKHLQEEMADFPSVARIFIADATGRLVVGSGDAFHGGLNGREISDRPSFKRAAANERGLIFEGPLRAKFADQWVIALSRRLEDNKGNFQGVVVASIPVEHFEKRLATVDLFHHGVIVVRNNDGVQVARYSLEPGERGATGDKTISSALKALLEVQAGPRPLRDDCAPGPCRADLRLSKNQPCAFLFAGRTAQGRLGLFLASAGDRTRAALPWGDDRFDVDRAALV